MHLWQFSFIAALFAPAWLLPAVAKDGESVPMVSHEPISATVLVAKRDGKKRKRRGSGDNAVDAQSPCTACESLEGFVPPNEVTADVKIMVGKQRGIDKSEAVAIQKARGALETGLVAAFIDGATCPEIDSEQWAIDYSHKRPFAALHKGVDIPQPRGTPIRAIAAGMVVGRFLNDGDRKGIEVMIRHTPGQTGLPYWTYSQYTHLQVMPPVAIGDSVEMGQEIGKTRNTGKMGRRVRRDALHFAIVYSTQASLTNDGLFVAPKDGYWMDPNAFYRRNPPYDSQSLAALPDDQERVAVPYMQPDGNFVPADTRRIWPYPCT